MRAISKHKAVSTNIILAFFSTRIQKYQDLYISILSDAGDEPLDRCFFFFFSDQNHQCHVSPSICEKPVMTQNDQGPAILWGLWITTIVPCAIIALRLHGKNVLRKRFGWDDIIVSWSWVGYFIRYDISTMIQFNNNPAGPTINIHNPDHRSSQEWSRKTRPRYNQHHRPHNGSETYIHWRIPRHYRLRAQQDFIRPESAARSSRQMAGRALMVHNLLNEQLDVAHGNLDSGAMSTLCETVGFSNQSKVLGSEYRHQLRYRIWR